jgi:hypothetical protein
MKMIFRSWKLHYAAATRVFLIMLTMIALVVGMVGCDNVATDVEIRDWYDLDDVRDNLDGSYLLMNDLDLTTAGYTELASPTANQGRGWGPIGTWPDVFTGTFDGQGFEISDLFIDRLGEDNVGLFSFVDEGGIIKNVQLMDADVTGNMETGALVGYNTGTVSNCHSTGSVTGDTHVGGLVGESAGIVSVSYSVVSVSGSYEVGGLIGHNDGTVSKSYTAGIVTGDANVGGLVAYNLDTVSNSYSSANVAGESLVGGLVGHNRASVSNCHSTGSVSGYEDVGGLVGRNYEGTVNNSFWDRETSGQTTSDGGTGNTTAEMQDMATFSGAAWNIAAVGSLGERNPEYIWNIVDDETYPFLGWQPVV